MAVSDHRDSGTATRKTYGNLQGVGRALTILVTLSEGPLRAQDLARKLGLKWATAYRTLTYLEENGYLHRSAVSNEYSVGARMYRIGMAYLATHPFANIAAPHLKSVSDAMGCAAQANEREGRTVVTVAASESPVSIRKTSSGFVFPLGLAAKGQLLLAFAPDDVREDVLRASLPRFTDATVTSAKEMEERLAKIRREGFAITRDDLQLGVGSVAAPICGRDGHVIGCISLIVRSSKMDTGDFVDDLIHHAQQAAQDVSIAVGWRPHAVST